jgi:hypothetical protein
LDLGQPTEGFYWKILAAERGTLRLSKFSFETDDGKVSGPEAAYETARSKITDIVHGVRAGDFIPHPPSDGCPRYCPAVEWCWKYEVGFLG